MRDLSPAELETHCKDLQVLGYTHIASGFPRQTMGELRVRIEAIHSSGRTDTIPGGMVITNVQNQDAKFIELITGNALEKIMMRILNDPYYSEIPSDQPNYILSEYIARRTSGTLRLHLDLWVPFPGPRTFMMQVGIALDDRGIDDGCTVVVPGTHRTGEYTDRGYTNVTPLPLKAGDVVMWDSRLWHGTTEQISQRRCWLLVATMQMWFIKPRFDATQSLPSEIYARLSDSQKAVLGFCSLPPANPDGDLRSRKGYEALPEETLRRTARCSL